FAIDRVGCRSNGLGSVLAVLYSSRHPTGSSSRLSTPYETARSAISKSGGAAPGHARHVDPADPAMGSAAWLWHCSSPAAEFWGRAPGRNRFALSRVASFGETRMVALRMETDRKQAAR